MAEIRSAAGAHHRRSRLRWRELHGLRGVHRPAGASLARGATSIAWHFRVADRRRRGRRRPARGCRPGDHRRLRHLPPDRATRLRHAGSARRVAASPRRGDRRRQVHPKRRRVGAAGGADAAPVRRPQRDGPEDDGEHRIDAMRPEPSYVDLVLWALDRFPERIALVEENRELTYREVRDRISQLAGALRARGFGRGNGMMTLSGNASDALLVGLAVRTLGSWQGSLHPMGSADDQAFILDDSDALGLVFEPELYDDRARELAARLPALKHLLALGPSEVGEDLLAVGRPRAGHADPFGRARRRPVLARLLRRHHRPPEGRHAAAPDRRRDDPADLHELAAPERHPLPRDDTHLHMRPCASCCPRGSTAAPSCCSAASTPKASTARSRSTGSRSRSWCPRCSTRASTIRPRRPPTCRASRRSCTARRQWRRRVCARRSMCSGRCSCSSTARPRRRPPSPRCAKRSTTRAAAPLRVLRPPAPRRHRRAARRRRQRGGGR